ncbi:hypothetical protein ZWY2020_031240 [Hordeum vulgare]|nr:hypothetical protein ZWY2020_031240 [Hordeum vulgare]
MGFILRVRLASFFAGAAAAGRYFLYKDYKLAHDSTALQSPAVKRPLMRKRWVRGLLKFGFLATLVGAVGSTGYATHAYSLAEVDHNTQEFKKEMTTPIPVPADATQLERSVPSPVQVSHPE